MATDLVNVNGQRSSDISVIKEKLLGPACMHAHLPVIFYIQETKVLGRPQPGTVFCAPGFSVLFGLDGPVKTAHCRTDGGSKILPDAGGHAPQGERVRRRIPLTNYAHMVDIRKTQMGRRTGRTLCLGLPRSRGGHTAHKKGGSSETRRTDGGRVHDGPGSQRQRQHAAAEGERIRGCHRHGDAAVAAS